LQLAELPVFYTPYIVVPAKNERQSGFLLPDLGTNSKNGLFYTQPFFWAVDSSRDLTLYESYMSRRGFMHGLTYRSKNSEDENIWLSFDFLEDRIMELRDEDSRDYRGDRLIRPDKSRWWLRGMYDLRLPGDPLWRLRADLDYISDQYYLRDFEHNMTGFTQSRENLFRIFSRDLREITENRTNTVQLFREWKRTGAYFSGVYTQNPALGNGDPVSGRSLPKSGDDTTVQVLPELDFYLHQGRILKDLPLEAQAGAQASYLFRREEGSGLRFDLSPRLILPFSGEYGSVIASSRLRATWYKGEEQNIPALTREAAGNKQEASRYVPDYEIKAASEFYRVYALEEENVTPEPGESSWTALRHGVQPRLVYRHTPQINQAGNPYYTEYDRLAPVHELVYSLDNVLTRKRASRRPLPLESENDAAKSAPTDNSENDNSGDENAEDFFPSEEDVSYDYQDIIRLRLEQAYDLNEARRGHDLHLYRREPWRDLLIELTLYAGNVVSLSGSSYYTPQENKFTRHSQTLNLSIPDWVRFSTSLNMYEPINDYYRQRSTRLTTVSMRGSLYNYGPWSAELYYEWPIKGSGSYRGKEEKGLTLTYTHQCFAISGLLIKDDNDTTFKLQVALPGLGFVSY
jgi:LPS-assembly protein